MKRGVALYLVGSAALLALAGCGRWLSFEQREPWRRDAEVACMKSGVVKQSATVIPIRPIDGPGICGAALPLRVTALGDAPALAFAEELRPPGSVGRSAPRAFPIPEPREPVLARQQSEQKPLGDRPILIHPKGAEPIEDEEPEEGPETDTSPSSSPAYRPPPPRLGPSRSPNMMSSKTANIQPAATLACPLVSRLDHWMAASVQPAAQRWFGQQVVELKQISAYSCRGMNGQVGARISEHAFGNALDIAAFTLVDGRKVTVKNGWHGSPEEQGFLRDVHAAACEQFSTVLAPGSNRFHYDHIHVDLARRRSGSVCNPRAIPGDLVASRASRRMGFAPEEEGRRGLQAPLPFAIPGQD